MFRDRVITYTVVIVSIFSGVIILINPEPRKCYPKSNIKTDNRYQAIADKQLQDGVKVSNSYGGTVVIKSAFDDKIMAISSVSKDRKLDSCNNDFDVSQFSWEPGSIIKPLLAQIVMDDRGATPKSFFNVSSSIKNNDKIILNHKMFPVGQYKLEDIMSSSINTGAVDVYESLSDDNFARRRLWYERLTDTYGFSKESGYDISNEEKGNIPAPQSLRYIDYRYSLSSFGIGIYVTPLQLVNAYDIAITNPNKKLNDSSVIQLKEILKRNLNEYKIPSLGQGGYVMGGKTGTSSMIDENLNYTNQEIGSFVGFIESNDSVYIVLTQLINPESETASRDAMKIWTAVAQELSDNKYIAKNSKL